MADFGDFNAADFEVGGADPTEDFLARERAILGNDAEFLNQGTNPTPQTDDVFGTGFETNPSQILSPSEVPLPTGNSFQGEFNSNTNDFFTETNSFQTGNLGGGMEPNVFAQTQNNETFSPTNHNENLFTGHHLTSPDRFTSPLPNSSTSPKVPEVESEFVRNWKSQFQDRLGDRDRRAQEKLESTRNEARRALENFHNEYQAKIRKDIQQHERVTSNLNDGRDGKQGWELVNHLIHSVQTNSNTNNSPSRSNSLPSGISPRTTGPTTITTTTTKSSGKANGKDTSRLQQLLKDLKNSGHVPTSAY